MINQSSGPRLRSDRTPWKPSDPRRGLLPASWQLMATGNPVLQASCGNREIILWAMGLAIGIALTIWSVSWLVNNVIAPPNSNDPPCQARRFASAALSTAARKRDLSD